MAFGRRFSGRGMPPAESPPLQPDIEPPDDLGRCVPAVKDIVEMLMAAYDDGGACTPRR